MAFTKQATADLLIAAVAGKPQMDARGDEVASRPYGHVRKANGIGSAKPDVVWLRDGKVVAAFEIDGIDVEEGFNKGLHKALLTTTSPKFGAHIVRAAILFQTNKHGRLKDRMNICKKLGKNTDEAVRWYIERAQWLRTAPFAPVPEDVLPVYLDDDLGTKEQPSALLLDWVRKACGER